MKAERVVLGIQKTADGGTWADGMVSLLITCSCSLGFPELGVREKPQAEEPAAEGTLYRKALGERPWLPFPASRLCTKLCTGVIPNPCAYGRPPEPERLDLAVSLLRGPRLQMQREGPEALDVGVPALLGTEMAFTYGLELAVSCS